MFWYVKHTIVIEYFGYTYNAENLDEVKSLVLIIKLIYLI